MLGTCFYLAFSTSLDSGYEIYVRNESGDYVLVDLTSFRHIEHVDILEYGI
jgi:hypothetical protein